jgi:hypothetical protein
MVEQFVVISRSAQHLGSRKERERGTAVDARERRFVLIICILREMVHREEQFVSGCDPA